jgi:hypothetical protein
MSNSNNKQLNGKKMCVNEVMRFDGWVGAFIATEVVLLRKLGKNEVTKTSYVDSKTSYINSKTSYINSNTNYLITQPRLNIATTNFIHAKTTFEYATSNHF